MKQVLTMAVACLVNEAYARDWDCKRGGKYMIDHPDECEWMCRGYDARYFKQECEDIKVYEQKVYEQK